MSGLDVERDHAFGEQVVAEAMRAVEIRGGRVGRQIQQAELFVGAHDRPHGDLARVSFEPSCQRVAAELALLRNGVKGPAQLAGAGIEARESTRESAPCLDQRRDRRRRDHEIAHDDRRRLHGVRQRVEVVALAALGARQAVHQVDPAVDAEAVDRAAGLRVDGKQIAVASAPDTRARRWPSLQ